MSWTQRTEQMLGKEAVDKLSGASVAVFGLGGVGSFVLEALVRAGVGRLLLIDGDRVDETNINRQLIATRTSIGQKKAEAARERALLINPAANIEAYCLFYDANTQYELKLDGLSYIADCIDSVSSKLLLIENAYKADVPIISCMGTGNKLDPGAFKIAEIEKTSVCPLARVMRRELKNRGISNVKVLYSDETPFKTGSGAPGSVSFVPGCAGLMIAGEIIKSITGIYKA